MACSNTLRTPEATKTWTIGWRRQPMVTQSLARTSHVSTCYRMCYNNWTSSALTHVPNHTEPRGLIGALTRRENTLGHFSKNIFRRASRGFLTQSAKTALSAIALDKQWLKAIPFLISPTMNPSRQAKFNSINLWYRKGGKLSFAKYSCQQDCLLPISI